jgi:hypothetical protein
MLIAIVVAATVVLVVPGSAPAQVPDPSEPVPEEPEPSPPPEPPPPEPPRPKRADLKLHLKGVKGARERVGGKFRAVGTLRPWARGQEVKVWILRSGETVKKRVLDVEKKPGRNAGQFKLKSPRLIEPGHYRARALHKESRRLKEAGDQTRDFKLRYPSLSEGESGKVVRIFKKLLDKQGYVPGDGERYTDRTGRAVLAFRKVNGMDQATHATSNIFKKLAKGNGAYNLEHPGAGRHVEVNVGKQVLVLAKKGEPDETYSVSTGKASTPTVTGKFHFYRRQPGYNSVGMYYSVYFHGGYAIHGYNSVPNYPASHGCVREPIPDAHHIYNWVELGMAIYVY